MQELKRELIKLRGGSVVWTGCLIVAGVVF